MRQHEVLRDIIDAMGLYATACDTETIGDIIKHYEILWMQWDCVRQHETP